jgi:dihydroflavonol-4-reductase
MRPVLVTGATGFLGGHLIERLKAGGARLRLLARGPTPWDRDADVEIARGDIISADDVANAMRDASEVYHLAGYVSRDPKQAYDLHRVHVEGARNICEAALIHRPRRIVLVSSSGTIAVSPEPTVHDETSGYKHEVVGEWAYYLSKIFAEKLALSYFERHGLDIVVSNPALLLGPGDERQSSTGDVALFLRGEMLGIPPGGMSFVDARDVAQGLIAAMRSGRAGERYLMGGVNWSFRKLIEVVAGISGVKPPRLALPQSVALWSARLVRGGAAAIGKPFQGLDDATVKMAGLFWYCDSSKARSELGFHARDPLETLKDTVRDLRKKQPSS